MGDRDQGPCSAGNRRDDATTGLSPLTRRGNHLVRTATIVKHNIERGLGDVPTAIATIERRRLSPILLVIYSATCIASSLGLKDSVG